MKKQISALFLALFCAHFSHALEATPAQFEALKPKFSVQDCQLWMGGEGHENENVPNHLVAKVEVILEFLNNLPLLDALKAIEIYCKAGK
jgi:hypothetical protein